MDVESGSPADDAGLLPGEVILKIGQVEISNLSDYQKAVKDLKGDALVKTQRGYFVVKSSNE